MARCSGSLSSGKREFSVAKNWEGQTSDHLWEQQALEHVREFLPEVSGYWALQSFSFTSRTGRTRECDVRPRDRHTAT